MRVLIKIGGTLVDDPSRLADLARQIVEARHGSHVTVVVHGGGRQLTRFLETLGLPSVFVNGLRVTSEETVDAVVKVLAGSVNMSLVSALRAQGGNAVGLTGMDARLTSVVQLSPELGRVGRIAAADASLLDLLASAGKIPVVACIGGDDEGRAWNINADQMASACACAFQAEKLIYLTDVPGVLDAAGNVLSILSLERIQALISRDVARGGMRAKLEAASAATNGGVPSVVIAAGAEPDVLRRVFTGERIGTEIQC